jgi:hypothetical protein
VTTPDASELNSSQEGRRCVWSCDPRLALMNARAPGIPQAAGADNVIAIDRTSPLALRNPMFATLIWDGLNPDGSDIRPVRNLVWKLSTRGQFVPQTIAISAKSTSVSPQSMRFIDTLGQLAIVDGSAEGLVLIDLNTVTFAHDPYF